jgi:CubicO group peptidase (beta-lactamase class C family)
LGTEVAKPLHADGELWFGRPADQLHRAARLEDDPAAKNFTPPPDSPFWNLAPPAVSPDAAFGNRADVLQADIPAGGKVTARAIARMYAAVLTEVDGTRLLTRERAAALNQVESRRPDEIFGMPSAFTLGFAQGAPGTPPGEESTWFGWGGVGGAYAGVETSTGTALAICKNRLAADFTTTAQFAAAIIPR